MRSVKNEQINGRDYYVVHKNYLKPMLPSGVSMSSIGGAAIPNTYDVYFTQNPVHLLDILKNTNGNVVPKYKLVSNMMHSNTAQDIPWILSRIHSVKNALVTDVEFGELIDNINSVYKNPSIDALDVKDKFSEHVCIKLGVKLVDHSNLDNNRYDAIFIGKGTSESSDISDTIKKYFDLLTSTGELVSIVSEENFRMSYEADDTFRTIFNEFGYTSSIKNIGTILDNDLIVHMRKELPNYREVFMDGNIYPNVYVKIFIDYILSDQSLLIKLVRCVSSEERKDLIKNLIRVARIKNFMYLPNVENHVDFVNNMLER